MPTNDLYNHTPFRSGLYLIPDNNGIDCAVCIVKATFNYDERGSWLVPSRESQQEIFIVDQMNSSREGEIDYPADVVVYRTGTDLLILGHAYGRGESSVKVGFEIDGKGKWLVCTGNRIWQNGLLGPKISKPEPVVKIPLSYAHAFGGLAKDEKDQVHSFIENPIGKGYCLGTPLGMALPNLEYPGQLVDNARARPQPAAFSALGRHWQTRLKYAGTYDDQWKDTRFPLVPSDFNDRYHSSVPDDQFFVAGLRGGERLRLYNMDERRSTIQLQLPTISIAVEFNLKTRTEKSSATLDVVTVEPDRQRLTYTMRTFCRMAADEHHMLKNVQVTWKRDLFQGDVVQD